MSEQVDNALGGHGMEPLSLKQEADKLLGGFVSKLDSIPQGNWEIDGAVNVGATVTSTQVGAVSEPHVYPDVTKYKFDTSQYPTLKISSGSEPLYTRDELVEILHAIKERIHAERYECTPLTIDDASTDAEKELMCIIDFIEAKVNTALLATGQLKVRE